MTEKTKVVRILEQTAKKVGRQHAPGETFPVTLNRVVEAGIRAIEAAKEAAKVEG